jgi:lysyl-tRNA synthetase class 2
VGEDTPPQSDLREQRVAKLDQLRARGVEPYAFSFPGVRTIKSAIQGFLSEEERLQEESGETATAMTEPMRVAGRVIRHRAQGKVGFADIVDATGKIQLYVRGGDDRPGGPMQLFSELDLGDIVGVDGPVFRTRRGEVSIDIDQLHMLSKALRPLPDKWHGLRDPEARYRQRHVDFIVNPDAARALRIRGKLLGHMRRFLDDHGFLEVETPVLHKIAGGAAARPFATHHNALGLDLYLRIALELHLKRMIVGGFERVYEIGRVFRNEGISTRHNPEFTLLELYQAYTDDAGMMDLTENLLVSTARHLAPLLPGSETGEDGEVVLQYQGRGVSLRQPWRRREMLELVAAAVPGLAIDDVVALREAARGLGGIDTENLTWGQALYEVFERAVEPNLFEPTFVTGFPVDVSPLARRRPDDERLVARFELFIAGQELANAFAELTDPIDQRRRFEQQLAARASGDDEAHPMDEEFLAALEQGMPPTGGLGIGIDRLLMLFADMPNIREVIAFPLLRDAD